MVSSVSLVLAQASEKENLYPNASELIIAAIGFAIVFLFMWKWVIPQANKMLEQRREKIQGDLERAEQTRAEADRMLEDYRSQLSGAREEANRIIEEARKTADQLRKDLQAKAEQESQTTVARAQEEIRAERDRVLQELGSRVGEIALELAGRVVGRSLDEKAHRRLVDEYIELVGESGGNGTTSKGT